MGGHATVTLPFKFQDTLFPRVNREGNSSAGPTTSDDEPCAALHEEIENKRIVFMQSSSGARSRWTDGRRDGGTLSRGSGLFFGLNNPLVSQREHFSDQSRVSNWMDGRNEGELTTGRIEKTSGE